MILELAEFLESVLGVEFSPMEAPDTAPEKLDLPADSSAKAGRKACARSRVSNGHALLPSLPGIDGRSTWVRRCRDLISEHLSDVPDASVAERSLVRRAAVITTELEMLEAKFAAAGQADAEDLDLYQRTAGNLRRLLESVGLQRRAKPVDLYRDVLPALKHDGSNGADE
jgi:hypothetical protein